MRRSKAPPQEDDVWGAPPSKPERAAREPIPAPPPAPLRPNQAEPPVPPPQRMLDLGEPPQDAAEGQKWSYRMLLAQAYETVIDKDLSNAARRKEIRMIFAAAAKHFPEAAKYDLAQMIREDQEALESRKRNRASAKREARPAAGGAKVIPIRRDG